MDGVINPYFVLKGTCQSTKENAVKPNVYSLYTQKQKENMLWGGFCRPIHLKLLGLLSTHTDAKKFDCDNKSKDEPLIQILCNCENVITFIFFIYSFFPCRSHML